MSDDASTDVTSLTVQLLSAYLSNNTVASGDLAELIATTRSALGAKADATPVGDDATYEPAVSVRKSIASREHIISMIDGKPYKMLKRHLALNGLTPAEYRARYNLASDYPMVAAAYSERRREFAKTLGLGRKDREPAVQATAPVIEAASEAAPEPAAPKSSRKPKAVKTAVEASPAVETPVAAEPVAVAATKAAAKPKAKAKVEAQPSADASSPADTAGVVAVSPKAASKKAEPKAAAKSKTSTTAAAKSSGKPSAKSKAAADAPASTSPSDEVASMTAPKTVRKAKAAAAPTNGEPAVVAAKLAAKKAKVKDDAEAETAKPARAKRMARAPKDAPEATAPVSEEAAV